MNDQNIHILVSRLGLLRLVYIIKPLLALSNYRGLREFKNVVSSLPLKPLLEYQPRFLYKFLAPYATANFNQRTRLYTLINHYRFFSEAANPLFFSSLAQNTVVWREKFGSDECGISLSFPQKAFNEAEVSLNLYWNSALTQVVSFVVAPGTVAGSKSTHTMLITQVQSFKNAEQLKEITKALFEITPASLLVNAAYGLATALGIDSAAGVSMQNKVGRRLHLYFDYDAFWLDFRGQHNADVDLYQLPIPAPEKPIAEVKRNHRARTLRKRQFKEQVRESIAAYWHANFSFSKSRRVVETGPFYELELENTYASVRTA